MVSVFIAVSIYSHADLQSEYYFCYFYSMIARPPRSSCYIKLHLIIFSLLFVIKFEEMGCTNCLFTMILDNFFVQQTWSIQQIKNSTSKVTIELQT